VRAPFFFFAFFFLIASLTVSSNSSSTLVTIFGGRLHDIHTFLAEERLPEGWESRVRGQMGLTIFTLNCTSFPVELGIEEEVAQPLILL
jgi:hypothetical protein